jgi:urease accessory protein
MANLRLLQLGDSALPIGGYTHSWGLEAAVAQGTVHDAGSLERWVRHWAGHALAPLEGVAAAAVCRAAGDGDWPTAVLANDMLWAGLTPPTLRHASRDMGEQLLALAESWPWAAEVTHQLRRHLGQGEWHHAPVFGALAAAAGARAREAALVFMHQASLGMIGAGVRAIPIGHTHGQQVLARLHDDLERLAGEVAERPLETAGSSCPAYEVLCHDQSQLYTRLFRS